MKNLKYLLVGLVLVASTACDDYFFDKKLEHETKLVEVRNFKHKLTDADYATLSSSKVAIAKANQLDEEAGSGVDSTYYKALLALKKKKAFSAEVTPKNYVPILLYTLYPELSQGSICNVTYKVEDSEETSIFSLKDVWAFYAYFYESLENSKGTFKIVDVSLGATSDAVWKTGSGMTANGYKKGATTDSWLISSAIDVPANAEDPVLVFDQKMEYNNGNFLTECQLYISTAYAGDGEEPKIDEEGWNLVTIPEAGSSFGSSGELDLTAYKGQKIYIGFHYTCGNSAIAWSVKNVTIRSKE